MAEAMVFFALERLGDIFTEEGKFLHRSVRDHLDEITVELKRMQPFLKDADAKQEEDESIHNWVAEIRDLAYRIGDVLEAFGLQILTSRRERRGIRNLLRRFACMVCEGIALHKFELEFGTIRGKITSLTLLLQTYGLKSLTEVENSDAAHYEKLRQLRKTYPHLIDEDLVGRENDEEQLMSLLLSNNKESGIICIRGIGGMGKTTITTRIYNSENVSRTFERRAWVFVSQEFMTENVLQDILTELLPKIRKDEITRMRETELVRHLYKVQQEKKCLVVLDNVWSPDIWESLKPAFPIGCTIGSKILITSRILKVGFVHELKFLNEEECWELFIKEAFAKEETTPEVIIPGEVEELGRKLVRRCCGLPLAIVIAGGALRRKLDLSEWKRFYEITEWNARGDERFPTILSILTLSYKTIPYKLRSCFLYLANMPEDYKIEVEKLFQLWIAENMISSEDRADRALTMMDVAEGYLIELAERNLVQLQVDEYTGQIKFCRIHDLIRDQILSEGHTEVLLQAISLQQNHILSTSSFRRDIRRLAIHMNNLDDLDNYVPPTRKTALHFRSVLFLLQKYNKRSRICHIVQSRLSDLKQVRVLDLGGLVFSKLDQAIGKLIYLKYLGLRYTVFHELPSTIENMSNLQTLDLWDNNTQYASIVVPNVFCKLKRLSHLYLRRLVGSGGHREKLRLNGLTNLETLDSFDSERFNVEDLLELTNLRKLGANVSSKSHLSTITDYLQNDASKLLRQLTLSIKYCDLYSEEGQTLLGKVLRCHVLHELSINGRTGRFPEYEKRFSETLTKLTLESCELRGNPISTLEKLPNLRILIVKWNAFVEEKMVCSATGFPQLRVLQLWRMHSLKDWVVVKGAMPNLSSLEIVSCPNLDKIPDGLKFVTTLKLLRINWMPKAFTDRLCAEDGKEGEDYYKVQHSSIEIIDSDREDETDMASEKKTDATPERGVVIQEPSRSPSRTSNTPADKDKGKALMIEP